MKITINDTKFLDKENDIKHKDILTIASEGGWEVSKKYPTKEDGVTPNNQFNIKLKLENDEMRSTTLSWGNVKLLVASLGDESEDWVGKKIRAWKTKSEKAKLGYVFVYTPTDWDRDDTGEWVIPQNTSPGVDGEVINIDEIPF